MTPSSQGGKHGQQPAVFGQIDRVYSHLTPNAGSMAPFPPELDTHLEPPAPVERLGFRLEDPYAAK